MPTVNSNSQLDQELNQQIQRWLEQFSKQAAACVVVVPVFNAYENVCTCIESLRADALSRAPVLILDDGSTDLRIQQLGALVANDQRFMIVHRRGNAGFVVTANLAFAVCKPRDIVLLNSDVIVPPNWLARLQEAAYVRSNVATATPLTNNGTILSVPYRNEPADYPPSANISSVQEIDAKIQRASLKIRPIIPTAVGYCAYYRRVALDVVGFFDEAFSPGYEEEVDFSQRAVGAGFCHVVADDVFVYHKGSSSFEANRAMRVNELREQHRRMIAARYPWYLRWVTDTQIDHSSPLALALGQASGALLPRKVAIDLTCVDGGTTGYQVAALEFANALARSKSRSGEVHLIVQDRIPLDYLKGLDRHVDAVVRVSDALKQPQPAYDVIFRPFQVHTASDLTLLQQSARRSVIHLLDLILYANPTYTVSYQEWASYRRVLEQTLESADGVTFDSIDVARAAEQYGITVPEERALTTYLGVRHALHSGQATMDFRDGTLGQQPFILMIGANYRHKNRPYALRAVRALMARHNWNGKLVLAGPHSMLGDSSADEQALIKSDHILNDHIIDVGKVTESEKSWLLKNARLVLYPSICEGFGLVPFEAALAGTPVLTMRSTSLAEVLGEQVRYLESFDPESGVEAMWQLVTDEDTRRHQVSAILARAELFNWDEIASRTWQFFERILRMPKRAPHASGASPGAWHTQTSTSTSVTKLINDARRRLRSWSRTLRTYGFQAVMSEVWSYFRWRLTQLG